MATPVDPDFRARLAALNERFAATVPATIEKITAALRACEADIAAGGAPTPAAMHQLHELLHGVAGSAGTFGFGTLGQEARRIEQMLRELMAGALDAGSDAGSDAGGGAGAGWHAVAAETRKWLSWAGRDARATVYD